jgi:hypothetical protein
MSSGRTARGPVRSNGPYDPDAKQAWDQALARLAAFNKNVVLTPGSAGTLDMLNRGEIAMGRSGSTCSMTGSTTARSRLT